jgi:ATP-dependent helicase/DNAse subunit B
LLQRAKNVHLLYNSSKTENSSGEPSRFILQLIHEWSNEERKIFHRKFKSTYSDSLNSEPAFPINENVLQRLQKWLSSGISFSALNTFSKCSLQFYFKYILKIVSADEEDSDDIVLGNLIHKALENVYGKWINQTVKAEWLEKVDALQELKLAAQHIQMPSFADGKMAILFDAAVYLFQKTIDFDLKKLKKGDKLVILSLESNFSRIYKMKSGFEVKIDGKIDRVDLLNNTVRLIDYKTGAVTKKLSLKAEDALNTFEKDKEKQLMVYRWVTESHYPSAESMIYPIQNLSDNEAILQADHSTLMSKMDEFLNLTVEKMLSTDSAFIQTDNYKTCEFCDFASICKRD